MNDNNLVYIKEDNGGFSTIGAEFKPYKPYRCLEADGGYLVYGEWFSKDEFNKLFEFALDRIKRHFELIGLTKDGKPISKTAFIKLAYDVKYGGRSKGSFWTLLFYTHPKEIMYRFSPTWVGGSKAVVMTNFYDSFINLLNGEMDEVDSGEIEFGNRGLPLGRYRPLETRFFHKSEKSLF